jgi:hypothetical protein
MTDIHAQSVTASTGKQHNFLNLQKSERDLNPQEKVLVLPLQIDSRNKSERSQASCKTVKEKS